MDEEEVTYLNMANWKEKLSNKELNFFYFPMTTEEFYNREQNIFKIDGQLRMPQWTHVTGVTTMGQAANMLAYHLENQQLLWFFKQSVEYGGTAMTQQLKMEDTNTLMNWCYKMGLPLNKPVKTIERLRGSSTLIQWLLDNNQTTMKMIEEARNNWEEKVVVEQQDEEQRNQRPRGKQQDGLDQIDQHEAHQRAQEIHERRISNKFQQSAAEQHFK